MKQLFTLLSISIFFSGILQAQSTAEAIAELEAKLKKIEMRQAEVTSELEGLQLAKIREDLKTAGLPKGDFDGTQTVEHAAMILNYDENHEQARWVAHIVPLQMMTGSLSRTNDFREDPKVTTGTAVKADYWYSGYDRGHLAPSADFRWSQTAISESYFYSNMGPQVAELNRERWADLERWVRKQVYVTNEQMMVITGPIFDEGLESITQGPNKVTIPKRFYKVILDNQGDEQKAIGFIMPNKKCDKPKVTDYAVSVDEVEKLTGLDFFSELDDELENRIEANFELAPWEAKGNNNTILEDVEPLATNERPANTINTDDASFFIHQKTTICGTAVSTKRTNANSVFVNLDTKFPNQVFSMTIWSADIPNFTYSPEIELLGKKICACGKITDHKGTPTMNITKEEQILFID